MIDTLLSFFACVIAVALVAFPLAIVIRIAIGIQTFMAVCKVRHHHEIRVDLCSLRRHLWRSNQYWIAEKMLATPLPFSRTRKVFLRKSCSPQYWDTFLGQQEIADAAKKNHRFRPILEAIVEEHPIPPAHGKLVYHRKMFCSVTKPLPYKPALETITERRFLRVRRPGNGVYGPFLEYAYHTINISKQAPGVDSDVVDSLVDDFDSSSELLVDPMFLADKSSEQEAAPIVEHPIPPARGKLLVYHRKMFCSVTKPLPYKPVLETITERRFLRVRRPGNGAYGPFLEYAYHTTNKSKQAPGVLDFDVVDSLVDDFDSSSELLVDPMFLADKSSEQEAAPKKVFSTTTSKKNKASRMPRRSVRIAELLKTDKMGSIWKNGLRRSARLASL